MKEVASKQSALNDDLTTNAIYHFMAYLYIGCFIVLGIVFGFSPILFVALLLISMIFILPSHTLGLGLIIFMTMIFEKWFTLQPLITEYAIYKIYPLDIVMIITIAGWFIHQIFWQKRKILFGWSEKLLSLFIVVNIIYLFKSFYELNVDTAVAFSTFKNYAFYPLLYFITIYSIQTKRQFKNILHLILLAGIFLIGFIVFGLLSGEGLWTEYTPLSTAGVRLLASTHAFYLIISIIIATSLIAFNRFRNKGFATIVIMTWVLGVALSLMRHLWLSLFIGLGILIILVPLANKKNLLLISIKGAMVLVSIATILLLVINLFPLYNFSENINNSSNVIIERITSISNGTNDSSIDWRFNFWQEAKKLWLQTPLTGLGFGKKIPLEMGSWQTFEEIRNIHNSPLAITIQMGIIGIGLFAAFIFSNILGSIKSIIKNEELKPYYLGLLSCVVTILFASLFQPYLETNLTGIFFWITLGLLRTSVVINKTEA